jgi:hypothetical protein
MFFIPGFLIALLTFPGVIVHEIAHRIFCDIAGVPVYKVCYLRVGNPSGYVVHGQVNNLWSAFLISVGPFLVNSILCAVLGFPAYVNTALGTHYHFINTLLIWLSISIGMHAFPSKADLDNFHQQVKSSKGQNILLVGFSTILGGCFWIARILSFFWFDAIYALFVGMMIPIMVTYIGT